MNEPEKPKILDDKRLEQIVRESADQIKGFIDAGMSYKIIKKFMKQHYRYLEGVCQEDYNRRREFVELYCQILLGREE